MALGVRLRVWTKVSNSREFCKSEPGWWLKKQDSDKSDRSDEGPISLTRPTCLNRLTCPTCLRKITVRDAGTLLL